MPVKRVFRDYGTPHIVSQPATAFNGAARGRRCGKMPPGAFGTNVSNISMDRCRSGVPFQFENVNGTSTWLMTLTGVPFNSVGW